MSHARLRAAVLCVAWLTFSAATQAQPPTDEIVARHVRQLKDADAHLRAGAAIRLGELGDRAAAAVPALAEALSDPDETVRRYAASALGKLGRHAKSAVAALGRLEADPSRYTRETAWKSLVQIEPGIALDTASLAAGLKSTQATRRRWSAEALALLKGGGARPALAELIVALGDESAEVRAAAAVALRNIREQAKPAVSALIVALRDPDAQVREHAAEALGWIGPGDEDAVPRLIAAMDDPAPAVRSNAARAFLGDWPGGQRAIPQLIKALSDSDPGHGASLNASYALNYLARHGHAEAVVLALREVLKRGDGVPWAALNALKLIGPGARSALPELQPLLANRNDRTRQAAAQAIANIGAPAGEAIRVLVADLYNDDQIRRERAVRSLAEMGAAAAPAVPELLKVIGDRNQQAHAAFERAAEAGLADAQFELALQFRDGLGTGQDIAAAVKWLRRAAEQGHAEAQRQLGILYRQGRGVPQDNPLADKWYRKSAAVRAIDRLDHRQRFHDNDPKAPQSHDSDQWSPPLAQAKPRTRLLAVTYFNDNLTETNEIDLLTGGDLFASQLYWDGFSGGGSMPALRQHFDPAALDRLSTLMKALPAGCDFVPVRQQFVVSCHVDHRWTTRIYDGEALPHSARLLLHLVGATVDSFPYPPQEQLSWKTESRTLQSLAYRADGTLLSWGYERRINAWRDGRPAEASSVYRKPLPGHPIAVSHDGMRIVTSEKQRLRLIDGQTAAAIADLGESTDWNDRGDEALFSGDGRILIIKNYRDGAIQIRDAGSGQPRGTVLVGPLFERDIGVSYEGAQLAVTDRNRTTRIWDVATSRPGRTFNGLAANEFAFSRDGKRLAAVQTTFSMWNLETGAQLFQAPLDVYGGPLCFSPSGTIIACKRRHGSLTLYDAATGRILGIGDRHAGKITALAFSADGKELASAAEDGTIKIWNVDRLCQPD